MRPGSGSAEAAQQRGMKSARVRCVAERKFGVGGAGQMIAARQGHLLYTRAASSTA